jgi:hypothetical protein
MRVGSSTRSTSPPPGSGAGGGTELGRGRQSLLQGLGGHDALRAEQRHPLDEMAQLRERPAGVSLSQGAAFIGLRFGTPIDTGRLDGPALT